ncbi:MAG: nuclear transport factor 2 family protein, partial [Chitinophagaceae bacterium]
MNIKEFIEALIATANRFDTEDYLANWEADAVLDDPSVGEIFKGHKGIRRYFKDYFIGYKTQTRLLQIKPLGENEVYI